MLAIAGMSTIYLQKKPAFSNDFNEYNGFNALNCFDRYKRSKRTSRSIAKSQKQNGYPMFHWFFFNARNTSWQLERSGREDRIKAVRAGGHESGRAGAKIWLLRLAPDAFRLTCLRTNA